MTISAIALSVALSALFLTIVTSVFSVLAYCKVVGMEKSTHQVQWVPLEEASESSDDADREEEELLKRTAQGLPPLEKKVVREFKKMYPDMDIEQV